MPLSLISLRGIFFNSKSLKKTFILTMVITANLLLKIGFRSQIKVLSNCYLPLAITSAKLIRNLIISHNVTLHNHQSNRQ